MEVARDLRVANGGELDLQLIEVDSQPAESLTELLVGILHLLEHRQQVFEVRAFVLRFERILRQPREKAPDQRHRNRAQSVAERSHERLAGAVRCSLPQTPQHALHGGASPRELIPGFFRGHGALRLPGLRTAGRFFGTGSRCQRRGVAQRAAPWRFVGRAPSYGRRGHA
jgi:hypothetical protein